VLYKKTAVTLFVAIAIGLALSGCAYQPVSDTPQVQTPLLKDLPEAKGLALQQQPEARWWLRYGSSELNQLFDELNKNSIDLATARQRIDKARALLGQQRAEDWPSLDLDVSKRATRNFKSSQSSDGSGLDFSAGYEIDLWGSRSAARYSATINLIAQQQEYNSLLLQLQSTLAQSYFDFLALRERITIAEQNLEASKELLNIIQLRYEAGSASGIEVNQQRNTYLSTQASTLSLQRNLASSERTLAVLLGRESLAVPELTAGFATINLPKVSLVQPASLLEYRPDIQLAESQLRIGEAALYQEKQKRWPTVRLSAGVGMDDIFDGGDTWIGSLVGSLAMPLFDAGKISQQIEAAKSDVDITLLNYQQIVIQAMQETVETLTELDYQRKLILVRKQELENNQNLYNFSKLRYDSGDTDFINLLTAQRSWFSSRDTMIQAKNAQLLATINVFKAMGMSPDLTEEELIDANDSTQDEE